jgi:hypothetical protein
MANEVSTFASDFLVYRLYPALTELGCDSSERDRLIKWFHQTASSWDASNQDEFDAFARSELRAKLRSVKSQPASCMPTVLDGSDEAQRQVLWSIVERERARKLEVARHNAKVLASQPKVEPWTPCQHWKAGNGFMCPTCLKRVPPGVLVRVQQMYENKVGEGGYRPFVLSCLDKEIPKHLGGRNARTYSGFADLENEVWQRVTKGIVDFVERPDLAGGGISAWLTAIVHSTVADHLKGEFREKRDIRKTVPFDGRAHDLAVPDSPISPPDTATAVPVKPENDRRKVIFDGIGVPYFAK